MGRYKIENLPKCPVCDKTLSTPKKKFCKQHAPRSADHLFKYHGIGYKHTDQAKIKIGLSSTGRKASQETREKLSKIRTRNTEKPKCKVCGIPISRNKTTCIKHRETRKGYKLSEEHKAKIGLSNKLKTDRKKVVRTGGFKKGQPGYWTGKKRPIEHRINMRNAYTRITGTEERKTPKNEALRKTPEYKYWRESVFKRDDYTCQECGKRGGKIQAHHIKQFAYYPELRFDVSNGKTLCEPCHKAIEIIKTKRKLQDV